MSALACSAAAFASALTCSAAAFASFSAAFRAAAASFSEDLSSSEVVGEEVVLLLLPNGLNEGGASGGLVASSYDGIEKSIVEKDDPAADKTTLDDAGTLRSSTTEGNASEKK